MQKTNSQRDYTSFEGNYQVFLPFNIEFQIGKDDPVRLLRHCIGGMDITALEKTYQIICSDLQLQASWIYLYDIGKSQNQQDLPHTNGGHL